MSGVEAYARSPPPRPDDGNRGNDARDRDRDRDPYRDGRRGQDRRRPPRGRSRSPTQLDRYQPDRSRDYYDGGRNRDAGNRGRRRSSPPPLPGTIDRYVPGDEPVRPLPVNPMRDPLLESTQVGFSYFAEWWKTEQDIKQARERQRTGKRQDPIKESRDEQRARIQAAYDQYKLDWNAKMAKVFVATHKQESWFRERYDSQVRDPLRKQVSAFRKTLYDIWERDMDAGNLDDFNMEGVYKGDSNGNGAADKEQGETSAANDILAVSDLLPAKGADNRDPVASLPTLLIKTITPAVSRIKIEDFCKEHLGEGEGGFRWLSLSDPNPGKKYHRLGWIMLNPPSAESNGTGRVEEGEAEASKSDIPESQEKALAAINDKVISDSERGDFTVHVGIHRPTDVPRRKALWDLFSAPERIEKDLILATRLVAKLDNEMGLDSATMKIEDRVSQLASQGALRPQVAPSKQTRADTDDHDMEEGEESDAPKEADLDDEEMITKKKKLDLLVEYLRRVHNFCFFCVFETDSVHELSRKCMGGHLRRPRSTLTAAAKEVARASAAGLPFPAKSAGENGDDAGSPAEDRKPSRLQSGKNQLQKAYNWVKTFEDKINQVLDPDNADIRKLGGQPISEALEEELQKYVKQEDESKFRCKAPDCTKLWKGLPFWRKHMEKRHADLYDQIKEDLEINNRYVLDPARLAQGRNDATSNGHFPINTNIMTGTPRNFTLNGAMMMPGAPPGMFNPVLGAYPMGIAPPWPMPGMDGGVGPMRTNMRQPGARVGAPGPYDRRGPPRNGGMPRPGRGSFVEGGAGTFPALAVDGRTVKSYNDLDAAGGSNTSALDY